MVNPWAVQIPVNGKLYKYPTEEHAAKKAAQLINDLEHLGADEFLNKWKKKRKVISSTESKNSITGVTF